MIKGFWLPFPSKFILYIYADTLEKAFAYLSCPIQRVFFHPFGVCTITAPIAHQLTG